MYFVGQDATQSTNFCSIFNHLFEIESIALQLNRTMHLKLQELQEQLFRYGKLNYYD